MIMVQAQKNPRKKGEKAIWFQPASGGKKPEKRLRTDQQSLHLAKKRGKGERVFLRNFQGGKQCNVPSAEKEKKRK